MNCPNCGVDLSESRKLVRASAKELVESLRLDADLLEWCKATAPEFAAEGKRIAAYADELETFKDRMRANGYRTNAGPVKDAHAAFRTHLRNAVKFSAGRNSGTVRPAAKARAAEKKDL